MRASFILSASFLAALAMTANGAFAATSITGSESNDLEKASCAVPGNTEADCTESTTAKQVPTKLPNAKGGCPPGTTPYDLDYRGPGTMRCRVNNN